MSSSEIRGATRARIADHPWFRPVVMGGLAALICLPLLGFGFTFDQGVFSTVADTMLRGGIVYRDAWEHKPPGVYYVFYVAFLLIKREIWAVRILEILMIALSTAGLYRLVERRCGSRASALLASACLPLFYMVFGQNTAQAESFQIPFIIGALLVWPEPGDDRREAARCFLSGALFGLGTLFKTPMAVLGLVFVAERLFWDRRREGFRKIWLTLLCGTGMATPLCLLFVYYSLRGAGPELYDALFIYPARYASVGLDRSISFHAREGFRWLLWMVPSSASALLVLGFLRGCAKRRRETLRWGLVFLASWGVVVVQGRYFPYHHLPMLPALAWGAGLLFSTASSGAPGRTADGAGVPRGIQILAFALSGAMAVQFGQLILDHRPALGKLARFDQDNGVPDDQGVWKGQRDAARYLRSHTTPEDRVYLWGDEPLIYPMSDRRMAGRNPHLMQVVPSWGGSERLFPLIARLTEERPKMILVCPLRLWWRNQQSPRELLKYFPDMQQFLTDYYRKTDGFAGYDVWTRAD